MDDVLQSSFFSQFQKRALKERSFFEWFKRADKVFEKYDFPCILAILAGDIDQEPEWVEHIKKNIHRYKIELHGYYHNNYKNFSKVIGKNDLRLALDKIEDTFGVRPTTWYTPWGRKGMPYWGTQVCEELEIKYDIQTRKVDAKFWLKEYKEGKPPFFHVNFHYWNQAQNEQVQKVIEQIIKK